MTEHEKSEARLLHEAQEVASWWKNEAGRRKARILELEEALDEASMLILATPPCHNGPVWERDRDRILGKVDAVLPTTKETRGEE